MEPRLRQSYFALVLVQGNPCAGRPGRPAEDEEASAGKGQGRKLVQWDGKSSNGEVLRWCAPVFVVTLPKDDDVGATHDPARLPKEGPPLAPGLQKHGRVPRPEEREDEARGAVPGSDVEEGPRIEERECRQYARHQQLSTIRRRASSGEVGRPIPDFQQVEIGREAVEDAGLQTQRFEVGSVGASDQPRSGSAGAIVTRRSAPSPTLYVVTPSDSDRVMWTIRRS